MDELRKLVYYFGVVNLEPKPDIPALVSRPGQEPVAPTAVSLGDFAASLKE